MWLLNTHTLTLEGFLKDVPDYAILSHRWGQTGELSFGDLTVEHQHLQGFQKVVAFCEEARRNDFQYVWVDTCCIDKKSSAELGEAINSMYVWYKQAKICYVFLQDVESRHDIGRDSWFTRGWTLQELIAPTELHFYDRNWSCIASKHELLTDLEGITGIPRRALQDFRHDDFCIAEKMAWAARRETTRDEDVAYCLLGLFNVNMPLLYGEGNKAFLRFQEEVMRTSTDLSVLLWQGSASPTNGMLAAAPSCFDKIDPSHSASNQHKGVFDISQGWTTNNAGISIQLIAYPYLLSHDSKRIFCVHIHEPFRHSVFGIFLEKLSGSRNSWVGPSYRRVTVDGRAWTNVADSGMAVHGSIKQLFITRQALIDCTSDGIRCCKIALKLPPSASYTVRCGSLTDNYRSLGDWPVLLTSGQGSTGKFECCFNIEPLLAVGLFGQIVITLADGVDILVCCGHDRNFRAICIVLPFCTNLLNQGLEAYHLMEGFHELCRPSDRDENYWDQACEFFAMSSEELPIDSRRELDDIGVYLHINGSEDSDLYSAALHLDGERFMRHYCQSHGETSSDDEAAIRKNSADFQHQLDAPRKELFGFYGGTVIV